MSCSHTSDNLFAFGSEEDEQSQNTGKRRKNNRNELDSSEMDINGIGVSSLSSMEARSYSFSPFGNSGGGSGIWTSGIGILGEGYQSPPLTKKWLSTLGRVSLGGTNSPKTPTTNSPTVEDIRKTPRPKKTRLTLDRLRLGLRNCVAIAEDELGDVKSSLSDVSLQSNQMVRNWGRYLKGLEYGLSVVESLSDEYGKLVEMREGVRGMAYAYSVSVGPQKDSALSNVKAGFRECTEALCLLESKVQKLLGVFHMEIKGIQGFSRLCGGDVFELSIRHGRQKWKTRGRVGKDGAQTWDIPKASFSGVLGEVIQIKAAEVKMLGKQALLGNKFCEITDLFSAEAQLMTVNLNPSGSLKLSLVVTWWPLGLEDDSYGSLRISSMSVSPSRKRRLSPLLQGSASDQSNTSTLSSTQSEDERPPRENALWERSLHSLGEEFSPDTAPRKSPRIGEKEWKEVDPSGNFSLGKKDDSQTENDGCGKISMLEEDEDDEDSLKDSVLKLTSLLEDVQGHFPELEPLHLHVNTLKRLLNPSLRSSTSSLNVESALECFDFLDSEENVEKDQNQSSKPISYDAFLSESNWDPKFTARTTDSGISLGHIHSRTPSPQDLRESSLNTVITHPWEIVLQSHVTLILKLVDNLGAFGPLRFREKESLKKLQRQSSILGIILQCLSSETKQHFEILPAGALWQKIEKNKLFISAGEAEKDFGIEISSVVTNVKDKYEDYDEKLPQKITRSLIRQILDKVEYSSNDIVTRFQVESFFQHASIEQVVEEISNEERAIDQFQLSFVEGVRNLPVSTLPPKTIFSCLIRRLVDGQTEEKNIVRRFLINMSSVLSRKREVEDACAELLESTFVVERKGGCIALGFLGGTTYVDALNYVAQTDRKETVRSSAKESLLLLGEEEISRTAFQSLGLS